MGYREKRAKNDKNSIALFSLHILKPATQDGVFSNNSVSQVWTIFQTRRPPRWSGSLGANVHKKKVKWA